MSGIESIRILNEHLVSLSVFNVFQAKGRKTRGNYFAWTQTLQYTNPIPNRLERCHVESVCDPSFFHYYYLYNEMF
jgi:hypothetical protein